MSGTVPFPERLWLPQIADLRLSPWALVIALSAIIIVYFLLQGTYFGLRLKAVGKNLKAAYLLGIPTWQHMMISFILCGFFAGFGGRHASHFCVSSLDPFHLKWVWLPWSSCSYVNQLPGYLGGTGGVVLCSLEYWQHSTPHCVKAGFNSFWYFAGYAGFVCSFSRRNSPEIVSADAREIVNNEMIIIGLAGVLAAAAPVLFAVIGETFSERAGVINLSMNGTILLSAMGGFAFAVKTNNLLLGFVAGALIGASGCPDRGVCQRNTKTITSCSRFCPGNGMPRPFLFSRQSVYGIDRTPVICMDDTGTWRFTHPWSPAFSSGCADLFKLFIDCPCLDMDI